MTQSDYHYFHRRAEEERTAGARASHPLAQQAHLDLAGRYDEMAAACTGQVLKLNVAEHA
jgi:hypothetical protein